jgi:hypothetical protein
MNVSSRRGRKGAEVYCVYMFKGSLMKPITHYIKQEEEEGRRNGSIMEGVYFFKVHYTMSGLTTVKSPYFINVH